MSRAAVTGGADPPWDGAAAGDYGGFDYTNTVWEFFRSVREAREQAGPEASSGRKD